MVYCHHATERKAPDIPSSPPLGLPLAAPSASPSAREFMAYCCRGRPAGWRGAIPWMYVHCYFACDSTDGVPAVSQPSVVT
jgi:hypothetical protein